MSGTTHWMQPIGSLTISIAGHSWELIYIEWIWGFKNVHVCHAKMVKRQILKTESGCLSWLWDNRSNPSMLHAFALILHSSKVEKVWKEYFPRSHINIWSDKMRIGEQVSQSTVHVNQNQIKSNELYLSLSGNFVHMGVETKTIAPIQCLVKKTKIVIDMVM